jgi:hypothetical protein
MPNPGRLAFFADDVKKLFAFCGGKITKAITAKASNAREIPLISNLFLFTFFIITEFKFNLS